MATTNDAVMGLRPTGGVLLWLCFPVVKFLHELGHAMVTKAGGGEVHEMGLMLLVMMPVPYVDASAANVLRSRWQRAVIGAAGMLTELFIAALAFYAWMLLEPGLLRAVCFNVMLVAGVSTLIFNGNPLLRYDAYYILADLIELPNLAAQSAEQLSLAAVPIQQGEGVALHGARCQGFDLLLPPGAALLLPIQP